MYFNINKIFFLFIISFQFVFSQTIELTQKEKEFLLKNPTIVLGSEESWQPHVVKTDKNDIIGYDISILKKVNSLTGANFKIVLGKWKEIVNKAKKKEIDGLSTSAYHKEREKYFNFSTPYISTHKAIIVSAANPKKIKSKKDLNGKIIGIHEGNLFTEKLANEFENIKLVKLPNFEELINNLIKNEIDVIIEGDVFLYSTNKNKLFYTKIIDIFEEPRLDLVFSIRKDWPEALSILNKGLNAISEKEKIEIRTKWFLSNIKKEEKHTNFTKEESDFLSTKNEFTMCIDPNWMPFEKLENGKHIGMSADYLKLIEKNIGIPIRVIQTKTWIESLELGKKRVCDIFSLIMATPERKTYLNFTKPYLTTPLILATRTNEIFITDITKVKAKKIGIIKGYAYAELLKKRFPQLNLIDVENLNDGLQKVQDETHFGFIGALSTVGYNIQNNYFGQLKISGKFDENWSLGIGVRNDIPVLESIFNKAIDNIEEKDHQRILNKWLSVKYEKVTNKYIYETIAISLLIIFLILFINRKLSNEVQKRKKVEEYLNIIIKGAKLGTWAWNPKTKTNVINDNWANIIGYTKEEIEKDNNPFDYILKKDIPIMKKALKEHQLNEKELYEVEFRMKAKDGSIKWIYSCGSIVQKDEQGQPILYAGIHQDITPKKALEEELIKQNELIYQQSRQAAMGEMLENIAHQWRQPLSLITTCASAVKVKKEFNDLDEEGLKESMDYILKSGAFLSQTIEDFRNFFKKDKIHTTIKAEEIINSSLQYLTARVINRNIVVIKNIENISLNVYKNEIIQALMNLFNNAVDALELIEGEKFIFINVVSKKDFVLISIKDNAGGIKKEIIHKIFDPYFTTKHKSQGTGIGLHMSRVIVEQHLEGSIKVSNTSYKYKDKNYKGALFKIKLIKNSGDLE